MKGYTGKILHVDLSNEDIQIETPTEAIYRKYLGGSCLGTYYLLRGMDPKADAYSEQNVIAINISPTAGAKVAGSSRVSITAKSPLTGLVGTAEAGGFAGAELRFAGYDGIVITGKAAIPKYLVITPDCVRLKDAGDIWGMVTDEAQAKMREEICEPKARSILIGPAGECMVRYANVAVDITHFAGRCGLGAVFGSKNFKGVIIKGSKAPVFADEDTLTNMQKHFVATVKEPRYIRDVGKLGTSILVQICNGLGNLPTRNWAATTYEHYMDICGEALNEKYLKKRGSCYSCPVACKREIEIKNGEFPVDPTYGGPEYETLGTCGSNLDINNLPAICKINEICNKYGMDTISFGGTIGFLMEAMEKGCISKENLCGEELRFGDAKKVVEICEKTAIREGVGDLIAEGTKVLSETLPSEAKKYALHIKGKELPAHAPHAKPTFALAYSLIPFGPDHCSCEADAFISSDPISEDALNLGLDTTCDPDELSFEKAKLFKVTQILFSIVDSLPICQYTFGSWTVFPFEKLVTYIDACTGWHTSFYELMLAGERRINMMTAFNALAGFDDKDNILPDQFTEPMGGTGPSAGKKIDREQWTQSKQDYYTMCGWSKEGVPTKSKLTELGLAWIVDMDEKCFI